MPHGKLLFYFNGFNSAISEDFSGNPKIVAVADFAAENGYRFVPVSTCYRRASEHCREVLAGIQPGAGEVVFCGSSMGGWFARILQLHLELAKPGTRSAAVAFNPAYDLCLHGDILLGDQVNFVTGEEYRWTQAHGSELCRLEAGVDYNLPIPFFVYIDRGDEVIGWENSARRHSPISRLTLYEGGCHSFDHFQEALADFGTEFTK